MKISDKISLLRRPVGSDAPSDPARRDFFRKAPLIAGGAALAMFSGIQAANAATQLDWSAYNSADTAVAGASMNALGGSGSYALGAAIDNSSNLYTDADLLIILSSGVTSGTGSPYVTVFLLPAIDGSNYPTPPGGSAGAAPANLVVGTIIVPASVTTTNLVLRGVIIPPCLFKIQIQNNLGIAFPATNTSTCQLFRYRLQGL